MNNAVPRITLSHSNATSGTATELRKSLVCLNLLMKDKKPVIAVIPGMIIL